ncbi:hypothetical protein Gogos_010689 [Gossypium gossypioides]|uniref:Uncharacterized protein n=1 Tax=Gossypium gossypioides TaxID=34282 RepID=A0A7J9BLY9_GOSGO|nr:hypothetical protein [Gossypium gossypioides]
MSWLWGWKVVFICGMLVVTRLPSCVIWGFVIVFVQLVGLNVELTLLLELTMAKFSELISITLFVDMGCI